MKKSDLPQNQLLGSLLANNADDAKAYTGYIGYTEAEDTILLYHNIFDLSRSFEIKVADVIHYAPAPESVLPFGGVILWLKKDSEITARQLVQQDERPLSEEEFEPEGDKPVIMSTERLDISIEQSTFTLGGVRTPSHPCR